MKLIERKEIFETHKNIASLIKGFQKVFFDEEYDTEDDEMFDALKLDIDKIKNTGFSLMLQHNDINSYSKKLSEKANEVYAKLAKKFMCDYDEAGSIGKRYRREDEIGTPYCVTVDFDTLEDESVTIRDRDTMEQITLKVEELVDYINKKMEF